MDLQVVLIALIFVELVEHPQAPIMSGTCKGLVVNLVATLWEKVGHPCHIACILVKTMPFMALIMCLIIMLVMDVFEYLRKTQNGSIIIL